VPANAFAWAVGMVLVFVGAGSVPSGGITLSAVMIVVTTLAAAGTLVGAIHGLALIWLLRSHDAEMGPAPS
jgi:hypothetical protein